MKQKGFTTIIASLIVLAVGFAGLLSYGQYLQDRFGATIPVSVAVFETTLSAKLSSTATSTVLTSATDKAGNELDGYMCFVINEGEADEEFVCGTASSTSLTSMVRGISPIDGDLEVTALKKAHRRGSSVKITNYPQLAILSRIINGDETIPNVLEYASEPTWSYGIHQLVTWDKSKEYTDDVATSGAANADFITKGLAELATTSELIAGTATGTTGAYLVVPNLFLNQTSSASNLVPVTGTDGKLSQGFIDLTEDWTLSGTSIFSGTTTISGGLTISGSATTSGSVNMATTTFSIIPTLPASDPTTDNQATRKKYVDDNKGIKNVAFGSFSVSTSTTTSISIGFVPKIIYFFGNAGDVGDLASSQGVSTGTGSSNKSSYLTEVSGVSAGIMADYCFYLRCNATDNLIRGQVTTFSTTSIITTTIDATAPTAYILWIALK